MTEQEQCRGRGLPECASCARLGDGDYFALVLVRWKKEDISRECLSYRNAQSFQG